MPRSSKSCLGSGYRDTGRCSYLYAGGVSGGERAAVIYSLTGIAKLNGVAPEAWLHYVFELNANHSVNRVDEILLWHCAK